MMITIGLLLEKISTGELYGHPLNCHAGPWTNTATTRLLSLHKKILEIFWCIQFAIHKILYRSSNNNALLRWALSILTMWGERMASLQDCKLVANKNISGTWSINIPVVLLETGGVVNHPVRHSHWCLSGSRCSLGLVNFFSTLNKNLILSSHTLGLLLLRTHKP